MWNGENNHGECERWNEKAEKNDKNDIESDEDEV